MNTIEHFKTAVTGSETAKAKNGHSLTQAKQLIAATGASIAALLANPTSSEAQTSTKYLCEAELNNVELKTNSPAQELNEGEVAVLAVTTPHKPTAIDGLPPQWEWKWTAENACPGYPVGCGTVVISKRVVPSDSGNYKVTLQNAQCSNNMQEFAINVTPRPAEKNNPQPATNGVPITAEEKARYDALLNDTSSNDLSAQFTWAPNLSTTTRVALGGELAFNTHLGSEHFKLGAALRATETGIPFAPELRSSQMQASETRVGASFRAAGVITAGKDNFFQFAPGLEMGPTVYHYDTEFVRDNPNGGTRWVSADTQYALDIGPRADISIAPHPNFAFSASFALPITVTPVSREVGGKEKHPQLTPFFGVGVTTFF
jgi:hypothetical protein